MCVSVRTGVACVWLRAVCASVCVWNVLRVCVMRLVCRPGVSMKILKRPKEADADTPHGRDGHGGKAEAAGHGGPAPVTAAARPSVAFIHSPARACEQARRALTDILTVVWRPLREVRSWIRSVSSFGMPHGPVVAVGAG